MEVEAWINTKKELNAAILNFLESESDPEVEFHALTAIIDEQEIIKNEQSLTEIFRLLYKIGDNHHRTTILFDRLAQIIKYLKKERLPISDKAILEIFKTNKRLLLLLFEHKIIIPNESILKYLMKDEFKRQKMIYYLFSEIKNFIDEKKKKNIEEEITDLFKEDIETFERKCKEGENDSYVCHLIRKDSIQEFISFISRTNLSLTSIIKTDFYESNSFLIGNKVSLIEYAFFFGSIQVIKYLRNKQVEFPPKVSQYAIHSNNPEIIDLLKENSIEIDKESVIESIKCHHNDIAYCILEDLINNKQDDKFYDYINESIVESCNYYFYPDDIIKVISNQQKFKMCCLTYSLTNITIPSSVTSIGNNAFNGCSTLSQISFEIPSSAVSIGNDAFKGCSSLTQISIPSTVTSIGNNAFKGCSLLAEISFEIPSSLTSIGNSAFEGCSLIKQISIPSTVTSIGNNAFSGFSLITQMIFPSVITSIGSNAFSECSKLTQLSFPSSLTSIGYSAFGNCTSLTQISFEVPSSVKSIESYSFSRCTSLKQISIPPSVTSIGKFAFFECTSLKQISIPSSVTEIGNKAFYGCSSLTQISIPSSVTSIEDFVLYGCSSLTQVSIPSSVKSIGLYSFSGCSSLTKISIPSSVTSIGYSAFDGCSSLTQISISSSVTEIGKNTFSECSSLSQISIPSSVTEIGKNAFSGCSSLTQITFDTPASLKSIGQNAFGKCSSLVQISIPSSVTSIDYDAFEECSSLTQITIPSKIKNLGIESKVKINII